VPTTSSDGGIQLGTMRRTFFFTTSEAGSMRAPRLACENTESAVPQRTLTGYPYALERRLGIQKKFSAE
jgi:hypothetical protein